MALAMFPMTASAENESFMWEVGKPVDQALAIPADLFPDDGQPYEWEVRLSNDPLPDGLSISPASGVSGTVFRVTGTPTTTGSGTVSIGFAEVGNFHGPSASNYVYNFDYQINPHVCWINFLYADSPAVLPGGNVGSAYSVRINAESCGTPIVFSNWDELLPPGLAISANGTISGTPTEEGTFTFHVGASVDAGQHQGNSNGWSFTIVVTSAPVITPPPTSDITAFKTDENDVPLAGATLRMEGFNEAGTPRVYSAVSNDEGAVTFTVEHGTYTLFEHLAPSGYNATNDRYSIMVSANGIFIIVGDNMIPYEPATFVNRLIPVLNRDDHFAYMQGYPDGTFGPNRNMTRAEAVVMFSRLLNETMNLGTNYYRSSYYPDVSADAWYANQVSYMHQLGVLTDYSRDGNFRPNEPVTRAEFATLAAHFDNLTLTGTNRFTDVADNHWAVRYINSAAAKGWIIGYADNTFRPEANITRAEVVTLVNRILDRSADEAFITENASTLPRSYSDVPRGHWAYLAILEASIAHDFIRDGARERWTAVRS